MLRLILICACLLIYQVLSSGDATTEVSCINSQTMKVSTDFTQLDCYSSKDSNRVSCEHPYLIPPSPPDHSRVLSEQVLFKETLFSFVHIHKSGGSALKWACYNRGIWGEYGRYIFEEEKHISNRPMQSGGLAMGLCDHYVIKMIILCTLLSQFWITLIHIL